MECDETLLTTGQIAARLSEPTHRVRRAVARLGITPAIRYAGRFPAYWPDAIRAIRVELARVDACKNGTPGTISSTDGKKMAQNKGNGA